MRRRTSGRLMRSRARSKPSPQAACIRARSAPTTPSPAGTATTTGRPTFLRLESAGQTDAQSGTFKTVTAGSKHSCAVRTDDTITCWGSNDDGETDAPSA